jgi:hypothetical protein
MTDMRTYLYVSVFPIPSVMTHLTSMIPTVMKIGMSVVEKRTGLKWLVGLAPDYWEHQYGFNVHGSVHRNNIPVYNSNKMQKLQCLFYLTTALNFSGVTMDPSSGAQNNCNYSIW